MTNIAMLVGAVHFLASGRSIIDIGPVIAVGLLNTSIWIPIARLAFNERQVRREAIRSTDLVPAA
jgi:hypothetical protein